MKVKGTFNREFVCRKYGDTTVGLLINVMGNEWEVYLRRPHYPFMYAFGCPLEEYIGDVFETAEAWISVKENMCAIFDADDFIEDEEEGDGNA